MINQKNTIIPTVGSIPVNEYIATTNFTTDYIEFTNSTKDWSIDVTLSDETPDATLSLLVSNSYDGVYKTYKTNALNIPLATDKNVFDSIMPFRFMKIVYTANTTTGTVSIKISN